MNAYAVLLSVCAVVGVIRPVPAGLPSENRAESERTQAFSDGVTELAPAGGALDFEHRASFGECLAGACANFGGINPIGVRSTTSAAFVPVSTCMHAGDYTEFGVSYGQRYEWSLCSADGGGAPFDGELSLWDQTGTVAYCYSNDYCGQGAKIGWTATLSGTVRVLVSEYPCQTNSACAALVWRCASCIACSPDFLVDAPGSWSGETCAADKRCDPRPSPEHVYQITIPVTGVWTFSLCGSSFDTYLYLGTTCCGSELGVNDNFGGCTPQSQLVGWLSAGAYFARIEGASNDPLAWCGDYVFSVTQCEVALPEDCASENEPACTLGYDDFTNGGCNWPLPAFSPIAAGQTVCGTSGTYPHRDPAKPEDPTYYAFRDTDWYELETTEPLTLTWTAQAEFPPLVYIIDGTGGCDQRLHLAEGVAGPCTPISVTVDYAPPGRYWFWVGPNTYSGVPCGLRYSATLSSARLALQSDKTCYHVNSDVIVDVVLSTAPSEIVGGQYWLQYDPDRLSYTPDDDNPQPSAPWSVPIYSAHDAVNHVIFVSVGIPGGGTGATSGKMVTLKFRAAAEICGTSGLVRFKAPDGDPPTRLADRYDNAVYPEKVDLAAVTIDSTGPTFGTPGSLAVCYATQALAEADAEAAALAAASDNCPGTIRVDHTVTAGTCIASIEVWVKDVCGNVSLTAAIFTTRIDSIPPTFSGATDITVSAAAGTCAREVALAVTASDVCDGELELSVAYERWTGSAWVAISNPYTFPQGTTSVRALASDTCGNAGTSDTFTVTVLGFNDFVATIELQGAILNPTTRCIKFTFRDCPGGVAKVAYESMTFPAAPAGNSIATATFTLADGVDCSAGPYDCVTVEDELHTLRSQVTTGPVDGKYVVTCVGADALAQGDLYDDNLIDSNDLGILIVGQWGRFDGPDTPCGTLGPHADLNANGGIDVGDYAFITNNLGATGVPASTVNLEWRPLTETRSVGVTVDIGLYAVSGVGTYVPINSAQVIISWNPAFLSLTGVNSAGSVELETSAFVANDSFGFNETNPPGDGDGIWFGLVTLGETRLVTPAGSLLTTITFEAVAATPGTPVHMLASATHTGRPPAEPMVMSGTRNVLGTLGAEALVTIPPLCRGDCDCDGHVGFSDIDYFVESIPDNSYAWAGLYMLRHGGTAPPCSFANCDVNGDGHVGFPDIDPFVSLIPSTCP